MSVTIQKIYKTMFEQVYPLLSFFEVPSIDKEILKNIFDYSWQQQEDYVGYGLFDQGRMCWLCWFDFQCSND